MMLLSLCYFITEMQNNSSLGEEVKTLDIKGAEERVGSGVSRK